MKKLRILTTVHLANPGACIFTEALSHALEETLPDFDVQVLNYLPRKWLFYEFARALNPNPKQPLLNIQRYLVSERFHREKIKLDKNVLTMPASYKGMVHFLEQQGYDALVVGMVIWDLVKQSFIPRFPNIYWLSEKLNAKKIAYAASGHRTDMLLFKENQLAIRKKLNSYSLIGVRDQITLDMVMGAKLDNDIPVMRVPDPAFLHVLEWDSEPTKKVLGKNGVDLSRPLVGFIFHGNEKLARELADFYHTKGYQIISLSMYNAFADVNLAHTLSPHEWANTFPLMSFCITDRFHGTIMCQKAMIPFVSIEPYQPKTQGNSKIFSLLKDFELLDCYFNQYEEGNTPSSLLEKACFLQEEWQDRYSQVVEKKLLGVMEKHLEFQGKIKTILSP